MSSPNKNRSASTTSEATTMITIKNFISHDEEQQQKAETAGAFIHPLLGENGRDEDMYDGFDDANMNRENSSGSQNNKNNNKGERSLLAKTCIKYKFEGLIVIALLLLLVAPLYFIIDLLNTNFDLHQECRDCFAKESKFSKRNDTSTTYVYNHTAKACIANVNFTDGIYSGIAGQVVDNGIIYSPDFCGAPECQSRVLIRGVRSVPYWLIFLASMFAIVSSIFINIVKDCCKPVWNNYFGDDSKKGSSTNSVSDEKNNQNDLTQSLRNGNDEGDDGEQAKNPENPYEKKIISRSAQKENRFAELDKEMEGKDFFERIDVAADYDGQLSLVNIVYQSAKLFGKMDPYLYTVLYLFTCAHFFYNLYYVHTDPVYGDFTAWKKYETVYSLWLNSGTILILCFTWAQTIFAIFFEMVHREFAMQFSWYYERDNMKKMQQQERDLFTILMSPLCTTIFAKYTLRDVVEKVKNCCSIKEEDNRSGNLSNDSFESANSSFADAPSFDQLNSAVAGARPASRQRKPLTTTQRLFNYSTVMGVFHVIPPLLLPFFITHVIPALVIFAPLALPIVIIYLIFVVAILEEWIPIEPFFQSNFRMYSWFFFLRLIGNFMVIYLVQTLANFSVMFYTGEYAWHDVIRYDFEHRMTRCYANAFINQIDVYTVGLVGLIFV